jgi:hypothetical protein
MENEPIALPVASLLLLAFGITALLSTVEAYIAHAFYMALKNTVDPHMYEALPVDSVTLQKNAKEEKSKTERKNQGDLVTKETGVAGGMRIDSFVHRMQMSMESVKHKNIY